MKFPDASALRTLMVEQRGVLVSGLGSLALRVTGLGSTFLLGVVLARALGPEGYGVYGLVTSLAALAMNVALLGTPQLAVREMAVHSAHGEWGEVRRLSRSFLLLTGCASLVIAAVAFAGAVLFGRAGSHAPALAVLGASLSAMMGVTALAAAELRGLGQLFKGQFMDIVGRPTAALLLTGAVLIAGVALTAAAALVIQAAVAVVAAIVSLWWVGHAVVRKDVGTVPSSGWAWLKAALPLGAVDILRQLDGTYGMILVGFLASATDLGIYRVALASGVLVSMPVTILHVILAPTVSRQYRLRETAELQRLLRTASATMVAILVPMLVVLLLFGRPLVELVFGAAYLDAWIPLVLLCLAQLVFGLFGMGPVLLAMADGERHLTLIYVVAVGAGIVAAAILTPWFGASGAAAAQIISTGLVALASARFARRRLGLEISFLGRVGRVRPVA